MTTNQKSNAAQQPVFGKRREPHTIIIARGDDVSHFTIRPWLALSVGAVLSAMAVGYLMATTYLVLRDDLIGATASRQARIQQAYEDRISALRAQVDRITSRQLLDQQLMETKVAELIDRQEQLTSRTGRLAPLLDRARDAKGKSAIPLPVAKPDNTITGSIAPAPSRSMLAGLFGETKSSSELSSADVADQLFTNISHSIKDIESTQIAEIRGLAEGAKNNARDIKHALKAAGLSVGEAPESAEGGPYIPASEGEKISAFDKEVEGLDQALDALDFVKSEARSHPIGTPLPGNTITSHFGYRTDPILGNQAFHAGLDFRGIIGEGVHAPAAAVVVSAGTQGGYGNMVELRHKDGLVTRFGHLSRIDVAVGQKINAGDIIGEVGSTGRSTGPHLHYEVRIDNKPVDPSRYIAIGNAVQSLL